MSLFKLLAALIVLVFSLQFSFGQDYIESEDWLSSVTGYKQPWMYLKYKHYTEFDVARAKEKLGSILLSQSKDEWAGIYNLDSPLSNTKLIWAPDAGFLDFYIYTCAVELRTLNYGKVVNSSDSVVLTTEKQPANTPVRKRFEGVRYVKVKWGDRRYLVEEDELELFCELAAGYHGPAKNVTGKLANGETYETQISIWNSFWVKVGKEEDKVYGTPILPKKYSKFVRQPLETAIISLGKYEIKQAVDPLFTNSNQFVTIGLGSTNGIKAGMDFYVPDLDERLTVVKVFGKTALAVLERPFNDETKKDDCLTPQEGDTPCELIRVGMNVKTVPEEFLEEKRRKDWEAKNPD
jgi:hypothetical protein